MFEFIKNKLKGNKRLCPYCFEYFNLEDMPYRCKNKRHSKEDDIKYNNFWNTSGVKGAVIPSNSNGKCPKCGMVSTQKICPTCHKELDNYIVEENNKIFAVVGSQDAGKSHYLSVLINTIEKEIGPDLNITLAEINESTRKRYKEDFYNYLYIKKEIIPKTAKAESNNSVREPLIFSLKFIRDTFLEKKKVVKSSILVFFDTAGEDLNSIDTMSQYNKYIYRSDGIIFLIDPLKIENVAKTLNRSSNTDTNIDHILQRVTELIREGKSIKNHNKKIDIPMAITFSKIDMLDTIITEDFQIKQPKDTTKVYDEDDIESINSEMKSLLQKWDKKSFIQYLETEYKTFKFFGISALGVEPNGSKINQEIKPRRVEDPLLWLLKVNKLIKE